MSNPKHLWSGDWELHSAAAAEELARRRTQIEEPVAAPPEIAPPPAGPSLAARFLALLRRLAARVRHGLARLGSGFRLRVALLVALLVLLTAGVAFGTTLLLNESGGPSASVANDAHAMLGIDVAGSPLGIVVTNVVPRSPAQAAGLEPGDLISGINQQPIDTVDGVSAALSGLRAGDTIQIQFARGAVPFVTEATLAAHLPGSP
jgi:S1-C subfamily serine protease